MPYATQIPGSLIDLSLELPILSLGDNLVLNQLTSSQEFTQYDVGPGNDSTLARGERLDLVAQNSSPIVSGTYAGEATITTAAANAGIPLVVQLSAQVNPIHGSMMVDDNGDVYFVSDDPLDKDHLGVTLTLTVLGVPLTINANISELEDQIVALTAEIPAIGTVIGRVTDLAVNTVQDILDTTIINVAYDPDGTRTLPPGQVICFVAGTMIETKNGPVAVENLQVGDLVLTKDDGYQPLLWIGITRISGLTLERHPNLRPVCIKAGALGQNVPCSDLKVSPQHRVLVRSKIAQRLFDSMEVLVPAKQLLQVDGIDYEDDLPEVVYVHFLFDKHQVVLSNGTETESLYTSEQALKSVSKAARTEIFALFPELEDAEFVAQSARPILSGRLSRKLATRHIQNNRAFVS